MKKMNNQLSDLYRNAFNMMIKAFQTDNVYDSLYLALYEAKKYIKSDAVILYKQDNSDNLKYFLGTEYSISCLNEIVNNYELQILNATNYSIIKTKNNIINKISFIPIDLNNSMKYILLFVNSNFKDPMTTRKISKVYIKTFKTILEKMESLYKLKKQNERDYLTKSGNRVSYEKELNDFINSRQSGFIYTLIDLFRLKYVNDNINHAAGDEYIKQVANLLNKYFPTHQIKLIDDNRIIKIDTGNYIYRIGGDEFVLVSKFKTKHEVIKNLEKLKQDLLKLNLDNSTNPVLGVNYGIVEMKDQKSVSELYKEADKYLSNDKKKMYHKLNIDRRT